MFRPIFVMLSLVLAFLASSVALNASTTGCWLTIKGERQAVLWDTSDPAVRQSQSYFESAFGVPGLEAATCPGLVVLRQLTPELNDSQREPFCLAYDESTASYSGYEIGPRDWFLNCKKPTRSYCQVVNDSKDAAVKLSEVAGATLAATGGTSLATTTAGVTVVSHSSGALIMTGTSGYIAGTLGTIGTTVVSVLSAPVIIGAAAVTVVVAGGSVYVCSE